ncbi:MAG: hypothetical protein GXX90_05755 [Microbacteriaceae bacterium]|nr:hypothetical protein [Microbacteriaceae bacterium]
MAKEPPARPPADDGEPRVRARSIRISPRRGALRIAAFGFAAWLGSLPLFLGFVPGVGERASQQGIVPFFFAWLAMSALISIGYALGYLVLRWFAPGEKRYSERAVPVLAFGDACFAAAGGFGVGFVLLSLSADPFAAFSWTFVIGVLFGGAAIAPLYAASWRAAAEAGEAR